MTITLCPIGFTPEEKFRAKREGKYQVEVAIVHFGIDLSADEVIEGLDKLGLREAETHERTQVLIQQGPAIGPYKSIITLKEYGDVIRFSNGCRFLGIRKQSG